MLASIFDRVSRRELRIEVTATRPNLRGAWAIIPMLILPTLPFLSEIDLWWQGVARFASGGAFNGPLFTALSLLGLPAETVRPIGIIVFGLIGKIVFIASLRGLGLEFQNLIRPLARFFPDSGGTVKDLLPCRLVCDFVDDENVLHIWRNIFGITDWAAMSRL